VTPTRKWGGHYLYRGAPVTQVRDAEPSDPGFDHSLPPVYQTLVCAVDGAFKVVRSSELIAIKPRPRKEGKP